MVACGLRYGSSIRKDKERVGTAPGVKTAEHMGVFWRGAS